MPLFKRLTKQGCSTAHFREVVKNLTIIEKQKTDIVFDDDQDLHIVLLGRVVLRFHEQDPLNYETIAQYTSGMVLGHHSLDNGLSSLGQAFPTVVSTNCVLLRCNKQFFETHIWQKSLNLSMEVKLNQYQHFQLLNGLSQQTLYSIMYEYG